MKLVKAGEEVSAKAMVRIRKNAPHMASALERDKYKIKPSSASPGGQWFCADCGEPFRNNLMAQGHTKSHRRAWWTGEHAEEP